MADHERPAEDGAGAIVYKRTALGIGQSWDKLQSARFLTWINHLLAPRGLVAHQFETDFSDGLLLINLLEVLAGKNVPRYSRRPRFLSQKIDNVQVAISFLQRELGVRVIGCNPNDIVNGNVKQIMGIIFLITQKVHDHHEDHNRDHAASEQSQVRQSPQQPSLICSPSASSASSSAPKQAIPSPRVNLADAQQNAVSSSSSSAATTPTAAQQSLPLSKQSGAATTSAASKCSPMAALVSDSAPLTSQESLSPPDTSTTTAATTTTSTAPSSPRARSKSKRRSTRKSVNSSRKGSRATSPATATAATASADGVGVSSVEKATDAGEQALLPSYSETELSSLVRAQSLVRRWLALRRWTALLLLVKQRQADLRATFEKSASAMKALVRLQAVVKGVQTRRRFKFKVRRTTIFEELVQTECSYVTGLRTLVSLYVQPLRNMPELLDPMHHKNVFEGIEVILGTNEQLLQRLQDRKEHWFSQGQRVGDIFCEMGDYLRMYASYVNKYNSSLAALEQASRSNSKFQQFLNKQSVKKVSKGLDIHAFLILPIQRIPRYVMLLDDMFKFTDRTHPDYESLQTALAKMRDIADYVNERKREAENLNQVLRVQSRIAGKYEALTAPSRRYVREGPLLELNGGEKKNRYYFLFNDLLVCTNPPSSTWKRLWRSSIRNPSEDRDNQKDRLLKWKYNVPLDGVMVKDPRSASVIESKSSRATVGDLFTLSFPSKKEVQFIAPSSEDKLSWMYDIDNAVSDLLSAARSRTSAPLQTTPPTAEELTLQHVLQQDVILSGTLFKRATGEHSGSSPWRERFYVVSNGRLFWFKSQQSSSASGCLSLVDCRVAATGVMDRANCFHVDSPQMRLYLSASDSRERFRWVNAIRTEIARLVHVASVRAKRELTDAKTAARNRTARGANDILVDFLNIPGNDVCADCDTPEPTWAHVGYGVLLCAHCSGIHRRMPGTAGHVKTLNFGRWSEEQMQTMRENGNQKVNERLQKNVPAYMSKPKPNDSYALKDKYICAKYAGEAMSAAAEDGSSTATAAAVLTTNDSTAAAAESGEGAIWKVGSTAQSAADRLSTGINNTLTRISTRSRSNSRRSGRSSASSSSSSSTSTISSSFSSAPTKQGWLHRQNAKQEWRRVWFVLRRDRLVYYRSKEAEKRAGSVNLVLATIGVVDVNSSMMPPFTFKLTTTIRTHLLAAQSHSEMDEWIAA
eukprot:CAMPEP_0174243510 /NCGR_PEP_ID=MMETSP0417-20130205/31933_1 /TAXON_ID=242541 /ORGANISM="Mayorella sp, Strain BSH-02190019" /LENGTH=1204 /DNA_ID=CAMNT_0015323043 /DNA_START=60 /DNA_END=3670 /DNA_ORIENTATION=-